LSFVPQTEDASDEERRKGFMKRNCTFSVSYCTSKGHTVRKNKSIEITVSLNMYTSRVQPSLGKLLGMVPRGMK